VQVGHYVQEVRGLAKDDGPLDAQLVHHARGQEDAAHDQGHVDGGQADCSFVID